MIFTGLIIGFLYGYISIKGQFCMNSGFSNVARNGDTTKLKSFILAVLIQLAIAPLFFTLIYLYIPDNSIIEKIQLPPLFFVATALGGFLFGIFMYFSGGCAAGIFYKIGEKNTGAVIAVVGFVIGVFLLERGFLAEVKNDIQSMVKLYQPPIWKLSYSDTALVLLGLFISVFAIVSILILLKQSDIKPKGAIWGWKRTGFGIGILGLVAWGSAMSSDLNCGMSMIPGAIDIIGLTLSWGLLFVIGIPVGAFWSFRKNLEKHFTIPKFDMIAKRSLGGLGLGASASLASGCTVGHGLTFGPLLCIGSLVGIVFIFLGSSMVGYFTRK